MPGNYVLLETINLTQNAATIVFDNIPQTGYNDLKIVMSARGTYASSVLYEHIRMVFNGGASGGDYRSRMVYANGSAAYSADNSGAGGTYEPWAGVFCGSNSTADTYSNCEIHIEDYRVDGITKTYIGASVSESQSGANTATTFQGMRWTGTAPITSITLYPSVGSFVANSTFSIYGLASVGTTPTVAAKATGGNIVANDGTYWYHAFVSSGSFVPQTTLNADVLVVAGGGGGGRWTGGGGGAGGVLAFASQPLSTSIYPVTIGAGGAGANDQVGFRGGDSRFGSLTTCIGGGGGAGYNGAYAFATTGGSGGGGTSGPNPGEGVGAAGTSGQGYAGGNGLQASSYHGGGGGGAGGVGGSVTSTVSGAGGAAINTYTNATWLPSALSATGLGVSGYIAGGGSGGAYSVNGGVAGTTTGGGGVGTNTNAVGGNAVASTGSGGGGSGNSSGASSGGGNGASGIVIIRYPMAS